MFGLGSSKCPLDPESRVLFEERARRLIDSLGRDRVRAARVALPTPEFFPGRFDDSEASIRELFALVARHMCVDPAPILLEVFETPDPTTAMWSKGLQVRADDGGHFAAGLYDEAGRPRIRIETGRGGGLASRVATIAHELGHYVLIGEGRSTGEESDHEILTEMTTVFLGLGIFNANTYVTESQWSSGGLEGWEVGRLGYLGAAEWAYSLALFAWLREETRPAWAKHLRGDIRTPFDRSVRCLQRSGLAPGRLPAQSDAPPGTPPR